MCNSHACEGESPLVPVLHDLLHCSETRISVCPGEEPQGLVKPGTHTSVYVETETAQGVRVLLQQPESSPQHQTFPHVQLQSLDRNSRWQQQLTKTGKANQRLAKKIALVLQSFLQLESMGPAPQQHSPPLVSDPGLEHHTE